MKDRIPLHPGRVQLVPVSGNIYDMTMADDPTEAGTPLNKANLMSDSAAAAVWPVTGDRPSDPTPSAAFERVGTKGKMLLADSTLTSNIKQDNPLSITLPCNFEDLHQLEIYCVNSAVDSTANGALYIGEFDNDHRICEVNWIASSGQYDIIKILTIIQNNSNGHYFSCVSFSGTGVSTPKSSGTGALTGNTLLLAPRQSYQTLSLAGAQLVIFGTRL